MYELGLALYNTAKAGVFSCRNVDKTVNGAPVRAAVAAGQVYNGVGAAAEFSKSAKHWKNSIDAVAKTSSALGYLAKASMMASNVVNPLICVDGIVKIAKAKEEDKQSEAIKQVCSLGMMFGFERTAKTFMTSEGRAKFLKTSLGQTQKGKTLLKLMRKLDAFSVAAGKSSNWAKFGIPIVKGLSFVCMSIAGYSIGSKISDNINDYIKENSAKRYTNPSSSQPANIASLTGVKPVSLDSSSSNQVNFKA